MGNEFQNILMHHGIQGQKWGVRRFQNEDMSLTEAGRSRYAKIQKKLEKKTAKINKKIAKAEQKKTKYEKKAEYHRSKSKWYNANTDYHRDRLSTNIAKADRKQRKIDRGRKKLTALQAKYREKMNHSATDILTKDVELLIELANPETKEMIKALSKEERDEFYCLLDDILTDDGVFKPECAEEELNGDDGEFDSKEEESSSAETESVIE